MSLCYRHVYYDGELEVTIFHITFISLLSTLSKRRIRYIVIIYSALLNLLANFTLSNKLCYKNIKIIFVKPFSSINILYT